MKTHFIILIDTSYSMKKNIPNVVLGLNFFVSKLKHISGENYLTVAYFHNYIKYICECVSIQEAGLFTEEHFNNFGMTALYDAIGNIFSVWGEKMLDMNKLFILSDGDDTCSKTYKTEDIDDICKRAEQTGKWDIIHCNTDTTKLHVKSIIYDSNNIEGLFQGLSL
jgi:hypothetical protein